MQLEQGNLSITEYATRFKHLARFYTQIMTEAWRCRKFEFGLKQELKEVVRRCHLGELQSKISGGVFS